MSRIFYSLCAGLCLLGTLVVATPCVGQGFSGFNGRNHPELEWTTATTSHFVIAYPTHLQHLEGQVAAIAETSYSTLSRNLKTTFDKPIRIYISDEDEIANGFAMNVGNGHTNIWVNVNDVAETWTGREKWLRKVISHELAHIFHYKKVRSKWRPFDRLFGNALPRFWTEGLAQYLTEDWDAFRGERWLRTAVLDDRLSYADASSNWNGRLLYAVGNSQARYFAETYGDSTLVEMLDRRRNILFGLIKVHDFNSSFRQVTGKSYGEFRENWRRHLNLQYNTLAATMENTDSLGTNILSVPGQYIRDVQYSESTGTFLAVSLVSVDRPVTQLIEYSDRTNKYEVLGDGAIGSQISSGAGNVVYSRRHRGESGSIINDIYLLRGSSDEVQLTSNRRAVFPDVANDMTRVAFVGLDNGTANIFIQDVRSKVVSQLTYFSGDHQIGRLRWSPDGLLIAFSSFDEDGNRQIKTVNVNDGSIVTHTDGLHDDRGPIWSPDGKRLAFTSLRDGVPNVFILNVRTGTIRRVTNVVSGTSVHDWILYERPESEGAIDSLQSSKEKLVVVSAKSKSRDLVHLISPDRQPSQSDSLLRPDLWSWTSHRPPHEIPKVIEASDDLVVSRRSYNSFQNLTHTFSVVSPYYSDNSDWGLFAATAWMEPLGKHLLFATGGYSIPSFSSSSFISVSYVNRQLRPTIQAGVYHIPTSARPYGNTVIQERATGLSLTGFWPLDRWSRPYTSAVFAARLRAMSVEPVNPDNIPVFENLPAPEAGEQYDLRFEIRRKKQRPYRHNVVHPLDGSGVRIRSTFGAKNTDFDKPFFIGDAAAYSILPGPATSRFLIYGRAQLQEGQSLAQSYVGLSRYDELRISSPGLFELSFQDVERVRGYRSFSVGNRFGFASLEYRIPLAGSLQTRILGIMSLGKTTGTIFADAAVVFQDSDFAGRDQRLGTGFEIKNALTLGGSLTIMHTIGAAWPLDNPAIDNYEIYYRIRTPLPF